MAEPFKLIEARTALQRTFDGDLTNNIIDLTRSSALAIIAICEHLEGNVCLNGQSSIDGHMHTMNGNEWICER